MTEQTAADEATEQHPRTGALRGLFVGAVEAARTRLDLAAVEAEIFLLRTVRMLLWALAAVGCALLAIAFGMVAVVVALWDTHRISGVLIGAAVFVVLAAASGYMASRTLRTGPRILEGTLAQLESDQQRAGGSP